MRDRLQIVEAFESLAADSQPAALATVVSVEGSSYRRPGARMLIAGDGRTWGTISGGCLERDVARRARMLIPEPQKPQIIAYETDTEDGGEENARPVLDPGPSLGCGGRIEILIQRITDIGSGPMFALTEVVRQRRRATLSTIIRVEDPQDDSLVLGHCFTYSAESQTHGTIADKNLPITLLEAQQKPPPADRVFEIQRHRFPNAGWAEMLVEWLVPSQAVAIFADGHDVAPLVEFAHLLGWHVTVVGSRPLAALRQNFPQADQLICSPDDPAAAAAELPPDAAAVVMAHNFHRDSAVLAELLRRPRPYIGILGPRRRTARLLTAAGCTGDEQNIYSPIGLDIGADNPEQVALAIVAEIQAASARRPGQSLRERQGPIHLNSQNAAHALTSNDPK